MPTTLEDLLDRTRAAAVSGDLATLAALAPEIQNMADRLQQLPLPQARILQAKAERNTALLQAALRGLRAAKQRLADIAAGPALTLYDANGRKAMVPMPGTAPPRRL